jgi:hypothetical protein
MTYSDAVAEAGVEGEGANVRRGDRDPLAGWRCGATMRRGS